MIAKDCVTVIMNSYNEPRDRVVAQINRIVPQVKQLIISTCEGDLNTELFKGYSVKLAILPKDKQIGKSPEQSFIQINNAMKLVDTEYTSFIASADLVDSDKYHRELDKMTEGKMVVYSDYTMRRESGAEVRVKFHEYNYNKHLIGNFVSDTSLWKTSLWHEFGGFDCANFRNYSFWDFWLKIYRKHGEVFAYLPESTWLYINDPESMHIKREASPELMAKENEDKIKMLSTHRQHF